MVAVRVVARVRTLTHSPAPEGAVRRGPPADALLPQDQGAPRARPASDLVLVRDLRRVSTFKITHHASQNKQIRGIHGLGKLPSTLCEWN